MPEARFGKKKFKRAIQEINTETELIDRLLDRLLENGLTATERNRIIAQLSLANSRVGRNVAQIEDMGKTLPESSEETLTK